MTKLPPCWPWKRERPSRTPRETSGGSSRWWSWRRTLRPSSWGRRWKTWPPHRQLFPASAPGRLRGRTPFNFPAMISPLDVPHGHCLWEHLYSQALRAGSHDPNLLAKLFEEAGAPKGAPGYSRHGQAVNFSATTGYQGVSFVGSVPVGQHVYRRAAENLKRVQCMAGLKTWTSCPMRRRTR